MAYVLQCTSALTGNSHLQETMDSQERPGMCSPPASIPLLQMLVKLTQADKVVEVGVFTGAALTSVGQH